MEYNSSLPIYLQVANLIKRDIVTGKRELGEKLPSVRELAAGCCAKHQHSWYGNHQ